MASRDVIQGIHQNGLPPLMESFAKTCAEELFRATTPAALLNEEVEETPTTTTALIVPFYIVATRSS